MKQSIKSKWYRIVCVSNKIISTNNRFYTSSWTFIYLGNNIFFNNNVLITYFTHLPISYYMLDIECKKKPIAIYVFDNFKCESIVHQLKTLTDIIWVHCKLEEKERGKEREKKKHTLFYLPFNFNVCWPIAKNAIFFSLFS